MEQTKDREIYLIPDSEGNVVEAVSVEVPGDSELRDHWVICNERGEVVGMNETRIGRVRPEDVLVNNLDEDGTCCYVVTEGEYRQMYSEFVDDGSGAKDAAFLEGKRNVRGRVKQTAPGRVEKPDPSE